MFVSLTTANCYEATIIIIQYLVRNNEVIEMKRTYKLTLATAALLTIQGHQLQVHAFSGECGVLIEQVTGRVLFEQCAQEQKYIASITKIMTAIVAIEEGNLNEEIEISKNTTQQVGSSLYVKEGDSIKLVDLIYGLMLRSGNDAAMAIAEGVSGSHDEFVDLMNNKAKELGLKNTVFQNTSGLDETTYNLSSAHDMALIQQYAMNNPMFREIAGTTVHQATTRNGNTYVWHNKHKLVTGRYEDAIAGKTGFTKKAHRTLVTSAQRDNLELIAVTLNDGNDWNDHINLFNYGFNNYELRQVVYEGPLTVKENLYVEEEVYLALKKDQTDVVTTELVLKSDQPKTDKYEAGMLEISLNGELVKEVEVYETKEAKTQNLSWFEQMWQWLFGTGPVI